jgi:hypothetical protein
MGPEGGADNQSLIKVAIGDLLFFANNVQTSAYEFSVSFQENLVRPNHRLKKPSYRIPLSLL